MDINGSVFLGEKKSGYSEFQIWQPSFNFNYSGNFPVSEKVSLLFNEKIDAITSS